MNHKICSEMDCSRPLYARGICSMHYAREFRKGLKPLDVSEMFWSKVEIRSDRECWYWKGAKSNHGHGQVRIRNKIHPAHRVSFELTYGPFDRNQEIDHQCRKRDCVNPGHLKPGTHKQNMENLSVGKRNKSGYRGVCWVKDSNKWGVYVGHNGKTYYGGLYETLEAAAEAAKELRSQLYTNTPEDTYYPLEEL